MFLTYLLNSGKIAERFSIPQFASEPTEEAFYELTNSKTSIEAVSLSEK
jgi:hypothetical protein